jgi:hypothetical protein
VLTRQKRINKLAQLSRSLSAEDQEHFTRGALLENALSGKDRAPQSLKMLGLDKRVGMFGAENSATVVLVQPPAHILERIAAQLSAQHSGQVLEMKEDAGVPRSPAAVIPPPVGE